MVLPERCIETAFVFLDYFGSCRLFAGNQFTNTLPWYTESWVSFVGKFCFEILSRDLMMAFAFTFIGLRQTVDC